MVFPVFPEVRSTLIDTMASIELVGAAPQTAPSGLGWRGSQMTERITPPPGGSPPSLLPMQIVVGLMLALKLCFDVLVQPLGDEAYYWLWGQHPALSYFDHPPLHAWALWAMSMIFGW